MAVQNCIVLGAAVVMLLILYLNTFVFNEQFLMSDSTKDEFTILTEHLGEIGGVKYIISDRHGVLSFANFLEYIVGEDSTFRNLIIKTMRQFPSEAFFWECKPVSKSTLDSTAFEYVIIPSSELAGTNASSIDFTDNFEQCGITRITAFLNIGISFILSSKTYLTA